MRLKDKIAIVIGAGQSPGEGMGNGRATALRFVQDMTQTQIAQEIGVSQMQVSRILRRALNQLRELTEVKDS